MPKYLTNKAKNTGKNIALLFTSQQLNKSDKEIFRAIDTAISLPASLIKKRVVRLRKKHPEATSEELLEILSKNFVKIAGTAGGASGAAAIMPGVGTLASFALTSAQLATFLSHTAAYVLSVAEVEGIDHSSIETRRMLLLTALLGPNSVQEVMSGLGQSGALWAKATLNSLNTSKSRTINRMLARYAAKKATKKTIKQLIGRAIPLGVGAYYGWRSAQKLARQVVAGTYAGLGQIKPQSLEPTDTTAHPAGE
ncbi:hypothetical protein KRX54_03895 [Actinomycetaceae bacterium TAE3-ERU4]|nr:hypothetical protein [Actinomycetaceae bacterium TAE3-ERU4]